MPRTRIIVAVLAALALAAPAASADPHAIDAAATAEKLDEFRAANAIESAAQAELRARGRDGVQTGSLAGTTDATVRASRRRGRTRRTASPRRSSRHLRRQRPTTARRCR